jgi:hypothetical protein
MIAADEGPGEAAKLPIQADRQRVARNVVDLDCAGHRLPLGSAQRPSLGPGAKTAAAASLRFSRALTRK